MIEFKRITWSAGNQSGSVRVPAIDVATYIHHLRRRFGRLDSLRVEPA